MTIDFLYLSELTGIYFFALSGSLLAARLKLDFVASVVFAMATGLGGGVVRDLILQTNIAAFHDPFLFLPPILASLTVLFAYPLMNRIPRTVFFADALGLSLFCVTGTLKALGAGFHPMAAILLGMITAVGGGLIRDTMANQTPIIFRRDEIYVIPAFFGAVVTAITASFEFFNIFVAIVTGAVVLSIRLITMWVPITALGASLHSSD